jgi:uncharacterized protein (TIGR02147 family)
MKRIEQYDNYRDFLRDYYADHKSRFSFFSNRHFCQKAGIKSPSLYQEVVDGKRNLTSRTIGAFIKGLSLTDLDATCFTALVHLNQSKSDKEREVFLNELKRFRNKVKQEVIAADHYEYFAHWYNPVLRELACTIEWKDDYEYLGKMLTPSVSKKEVQESIELLVHLGFIKKDTNGKYLQQSAAITTGSHVRSVGIRSLNRQFSELGTRSLDTVNPAERHVSSMTIGISADSFRKIEQEVEEFKERIRRIVDDDKKSDQVYSLNVQVFPLSRKNKDSKQ